MYLTGGTRTCQVFRVCRSSHYLGVCALLGTGDTLQGVRRMSSGFLCVVRHTPTRPLALPLALVGDSACSCTHTISERSALVCCPLRLGYVLPHGVHGTGDKGRTDNRGADTRTSATVVIA